MHNTCTNVQLVGSLDYNLLYFDDCLHKCGVYDYTMHICAHSSTLCKEKEEQSQEERGRLECLKIPCSMFRGVEAI